MSPSVTCRALTTRPRIRTAAATAITLWVVFTVIYSLNLGGPLEAILFFIPGLLGISILILAGFEPKQCYLRVARISRAGLVVLAAFSVMLVPILLSGEWVGWNWLSVLIYAPASGIAQELFFRATMLPVFLMLLRGRPLLAVFLHSVLFAIWHVPLAFITAPVPGAVAVILVTFLGGMAWGWQTQRDGTLIWAVLQHCLFLMAMGLFEW